MLSDASLPVHITPDVHGITHEHISEHAHNVLQRLVDGGFSAYLVGGCVRDLLRGLTPKDFDVVTDATPEQVRSLFRHARIIGRRFRIVHVVFRHDMIEVTTFRGGNDDSVRRSTEGRILRDNVFGSIDEDVWRRDFACNALYYDYVDGRIVDYVKGWEDVQTGHLRLIGDPETRYREDPVRMLRAARFQAKLGFGMTDETRDAIAVCCPQLKEIAPARLFDESLKMFQGGHAVASFRQLRELDLLRWLLPDLNEQLDRDYARVATLVEAVLGGTDERIARGLPVNPAFLFAGLLWEGLRSRREFWLHQRLDADSAMALAADEVIEGCIRSVAIPRRLTDIIRELWDLQPALERLGRPVPGQKELTDEQQALLAHGWFRAALDLLCLRSRAGDCAESICTFWRAYAPERDLDSGDLPGGEHAHPRAKTDRPGTGRRRGRSRTRRARRPRQ